MKGFRTQGFRMKGFRNQGYRMKGYRNQGFKARVMRALEKAVAIILYYPEEEPRVQPP